MERWEQTVSPWWSMFNVGICCIGIFPGEKMAREERHALLTPGSSTYKCPAENKYSNGEKGTHS